MIFDTLAQAIGQKKNPTCVGLDTQKTHVPEEIAQRYHMHTQAAAADAIAASELPVTRIGTTGGDAVRSEGFSVTVAALREENERFFREWMEG